MKTVKPVEPIHAVRGIRSIALRRVPSFKQLRLWLAFARQKAKDRPARQTADGPAIVPPDASADSPLHESPEHIDKRV